MPLSHSVLSSLRNLVDYLVGYQASLICFRPGRASGQWSGCHHPSNDELAGNSYFFSFQASSFGVVRKFYRCLLRWIVVVDEMLITTRRQGNIFDRGWSNVSLRLCFPLRDRTSARHSLQCSSGPFQQMRANVLKGVVQTSNWDKDRLPASVRWLLPS